MHLDFKNNVRDKILLCGVGGGRIFDQFESGFLNLSIIDILSWIILAGWWGPPYVLEDTATTH